jgi:hypothetical protein
MSIRVLKGTYLRDTDLKSAAEAVRFAGYTIEDAYTPFAVHGLDRAMGLKPSRLTWVCFLCGLFGAAFMLWFQFWSSAVDWPLDVGGKPYNSLPAFIPVTFEGAVLVGGLGVVAALFLVCGLRPGKKADLTAEGVTNDKLVLVVRQAGPEADPAHLRWLLGHHGAVEVTEGLVR